MSKSDQRYAVITGASRGIGASILNLFAKSGISIIACSKTRSPTFDNLCNSAAAKYGVEIIPFYFNMENDDEVVNSAKKIVELNVNIESLINNAGTAHGSLVHMTRASDLRRVFEVNFFSVFLFTQIISKAMIRKKQGSIVNVASTAALRADSGSSVYSASKAALISFTKVLATELGNSGIRVNAVAPSITETDMYEEMDKRAREELINTSALRRAATPIEIAEVVLFLCKTESSFVNGQVVRVDGGHR